MSTFLRKAEVASLLRVTTRTVENYIKSGRIPAPVRINGGRPLWDHAALLQALRGEAQ